MVPTGCSNYKAIMPSEYISTLKSKNLTEECCSGAA